MKKEFLLFVFLLYIQSVVGQENKRILINTSENSKDSIISLQKKQHLLGLKIQKIKDKYQLEGISISDTLYLYIKNNHATDSITTSFARLNSMLKMYNAKIYKKGYIFNVLKPDSIKVKNNHVYLFYQSKLNKKALIDSIILNNKQRLASNIKKYLANHYYKKKIDSTTISSLKAFAQHSGYKIIKPPEVWFQNNKNIIILNAQPNNHNTLNALLGFDYDQQNNKLFLSGYVNTKLFNLFGLNDQLHLYGQKNTSKQDYVVNLHLPYLFGTNLSTQYDLLIERKDTTEINSRQSLLLGWQFRRHQLGLQFDYEQKNAVQNTNRKYIGVNYEYKFLDDFTGNKEPSNIFISQLSYNTQSGGKDFFWYNHLNYYIKTYPKQGLNISINTYYQNDKISNQFLQSKKSFFRNFLVINNSFLSAFSFQNSYVFKRKNVHIYGIIDFVRKKSIEKVSFSYINTGFGIRIFNQKQDLTLAIFKAIKLSQFIDNQNITINISQTINL